MHSSYIKKKGKSSLVLTWNIELTKVMFLYLVFLLFTLVCCERWMKDERLKQNPATIIQKINSNSRYVCQIFKSMKLLSMNGCQEWYLKFKKKTKDVHTLTPCVQGWCKHFPTLPVAVLLLPNNFAPLLRSRLKL